MSYLVEDLIEDVKDRSFAPISQNTFQDQDIINLLNKEQSLKLVAKILRQREDFFLSRKLIPLVASKDRYIIPKRAIGNAIKAVFHVDSGGKTRMLRRRDLDRIDEYDSSSGDSSEFYFEADEIVLMRPPATAEGSLLVSFPRRPSNLTLTSACAKITSISSDATHTTFTVDTNLTDSLEDGDSVDFLSQWSPFQLWAEEISIVEITTTTIRVLKSDVAGVDGSVEPIANDYICPYGTTNIPQLPIEFHAVLAEMGACRMLRSLGDLQKWQASKAELNDLFDNAIATIKNRAESSPERPSRKRGLIRTFGR